MNRKFRKAAKWANLKRERIAQVLIVFNSILFIIQLRAPLLSLGSPSELSQNTHESSIVRTASGDEITFHNGGWSSKGSCWCGLDTYCMCTPSLAIDLVIVDEKDDDLVWLVRRKDTGQLAVMGGFVQIGESTDEAVTRELKEETGVDVPKSSLSLMGVYGDPMRDKRRHTISVVYIAVFPSDTAPKAGDDVKDVIQMSLKDVESLDIEDFFADHWTILMDFIDLRSNKIYERNWTRGAHQLEENIDFRRSVCAPHRK